MYYLLLHLKQKNMEYAIYYKKRPSLSPDVPAHVQEVYAFDVIGYNSLEELQQKGYGKPDEAGFETEAKAKAAAEIMIGQAL